MPLYVTRIRCFVVPVIPASALKMMAPQKSDHAPAQPALPALVRLEIELLRMRRRLIGDEQGDPVWAMVLELCSARLEERELSVTSLCLASGLPVTTALRRLDELERDGRIKRQPDKADRRRVFVELDESYHERVVAQILTMNQVRNEMLGSSNT